MPEQPLYQGARPNLGEGIHPLSSPTPGLQAAEESNKRFASTLDAAEAQFFKLQDFGQRQKLEEQISAEISEFDREFLRRANLAPGSTGALYLKDGRLNETALDNLVYKYSARINQTRRHFVNSENAIEAAALRSENIERLKTRAFGQAAQQEITNVRRNFESNLELSLTRKSYREAADIVDRAVDNGLITRTDADIRKQKITHDAEMEDAKLLLATNPDELNKRLNDQHYDNILSPLEQEELRRGLSQKRGEKEAEFFRTFILTKGGKGTKGIEFTGYVTKQQAAWFKEVANGNLSHVRSAIEAGAIEEAICAPVDKSQQEWEEWKAHYLRVYEALGKDKTFLERQLKSAEERNKRLDSPSIKLDVFLNHAESQGLLINKKKAAEERKKYADRAKWDTGGEFRSKHPYNQKDKPEAAFGKFIQQELLPQHAAALRAQIAERWAAWRDYTPEGQKADIAGQQEKLQSIIRDVTGNKDYTLVDAGDGLADAVQQARTAQNNRYLAWVRKQNNYGENPTLEQHALDTETPEPSELERVPIDTRPPAEPPTFTAPLGFDANPDLPEGILIPEAQAKGLDTKNAVVDVTFDNKRYRRFLIVGTCKGNSPQMTYAVANGDWRDPKRVYNASFQIIKGDAAELMKIMGTDDGIDPQGAADLEAYEDAEEATPMSDTSLVAGTGADPLAYHNEPLPL